MPPRKVRVSYHRPGGLPHEALAAAGRSGGRGLVSIRCVALRCVALRRGRASKPRGTRPGRDAAPRYLAIWRAKLPPYSSYATCQTAEFLIGGVSLNDP